MKTGKGNLLKRTVPQILIMFSSVYVLVNYMTKTIEKSLR
jgi:hypothetical protein